MEDDKEQEDRMRSRKKNGEKGAEDGEVDR